MNKDTKEKYCPPRRNNNLFCGVPRMKRNPLHWTSLAILGLCTITGVTRYSQGQLITSAQINDIQNKNILSETDLQTLGQYVKEQFTAIMAEQSFSASFQQAVQNLIQSASAKNRTSAETVQKYSDTYAQAVNDMSAVAMKHAAGKENQDLADQLRRSTVAIVSNTDNPLVLDTLLGLAGHEDPLIRYQAIRGLERPGMIRYFQGEQGKEKTDTLIGKLLSILDKENTPEVIRQIAYSAAAADPVKAIEVLKKAMAKRLVLYTDWTVQEELVDLDLYALAFNLLNNPALQEQNNETAQKELVKSAGELYSAAFYRYAKGTQQKDEKGQVLNVLSSDSQTQLQTFLIEAEIILGRAVSQKAPEIAAGGGRFQKMISSPNRDLDRVYELLFGPAGILNRAFKFSETQESGPPLFAPIPDPPANLIEQANNIRNAQANILKIEERKN